MTSSILFTLWNVQEFYSCKFFHEYVQEFYSYFLYTQGLIESILTTRLEISFFPESTAFSNFITNCASPKNSFWQIRMYIFLIFCYLVCCFSTLEMCELVFPVDWLESSQVDFCRLTWVESSRVDFSKSTWLQNMPKIIVFWRQNTMIFGLFWILLIY